MNRQLTGKSIRDATEASPLSLLVHAADSQRSSGKGGGKAGNNGSQRHENSLRIPDGAPSASLEEQMAQRQAAARVEALHHQGLLSQLRGGALGDADIFQQNAAIVAAQQQQQAAALALASDIRTAVAAAQLRQAAQLQNQDLLLARTAALQQLGALGGGGNMDQIHQELELQRLEELERRQLLAAATGGAPMGALAARQQLELQEAQIRQEQLDRQLSSQSESLLDRAGLRAPADSGINRNSNEEVNSKESFQKTPGSVVVPCRARGMPMDHNFKTAYFVIPENVEHGEELICSYFACRNAGIKFRYCTHCKVPVAKRNFRKRHKHGKTTSADADEDESVAEEEELLSKSKKAIPPPVVEEPPKKKEVIQSYHEIPKKMEVESRSPDKMEQKLHRNINSNNSKSYDSGQRENNIQSVPVANTNSNKAKSKESRLVSDETDAANLLSITHQPRPKISVEREHLWAQLLAKRPPTKDGEAVSAWLMEVLSVSDLDTPLKENGQVAPSARAVVSLPFKTGSVPDTAAQIAAKDWGKRKQEVTEITSNSCQHSNNNMLIKKKRPLSMLQKNTADEIASSSTSQRVTNHVVKPQGKKDVGSFAEWKDRKKHKGLPKKGFSMQSD
mmetsp:Transcript_31413/g.34777  ORF Transcript_31413/g.34777 Transcript_31413/m.34777 type:complete len:620 (+) Transcript_31413:70-1929(+)|eukprot:CAMPEP_0194147714 /NCGR_PEP_ID=MMETSP0152-20130528/27232_1 /TAXON_ID=1049557 /ORGANISM="Thalassiothrix antarctica, Strain L6-D1" /LENGTH=619 /DNA_ID=CAMNT_0038848727 /DNA_START=67 /DNA_END=1926 /DNA_ORIENTATION=-